MFDGLPPPDPPRETIVITAKALPDPESERAFDVVEFDQERLRTTPSSQLEEVLKQVPGLQLFRRSDARSGHPTSQGVTLRALGGNASSRALLVLDGVPQADPFGGWVNWPAYDPAALEEVRVVRGGGSVAHGPGAVAGVITMTSRAAPAADAGLHVGSRDSIEGRVHVGERVGQSFLTLSARAASGDGFIPVTDETRGPVDEAAGYHQASLRALWVAPLSDGVELQAGALAFADERERGVPFTGNETEGLDGSLRLIGTGRWGWSVLGYAQGRRFESSFASVDDERTTATRVALQDAVPSHAFGGSFEVRPPIGRGLELRLGGDARATEGESRELYFFVDGDPTRRRRSGGQSLTAGLFAEGSGRFGRLTLSGGGRLDYWRIADGSLQERVLATGASLRDDEYPSRDGWLPTARAGAVYDLGGGYSLRSAAYLGWRLATLNELFRPFRVGADATAANALLEPERLRGVEAGIDYRRDGLALSLTAFDNRLRDAIANVTLAQGPGVFPGVGFVGDGGEYRQRRNLDAVHVRGIEASAEASRGPWTLNAGLSLVDAEVLADGPAGRLDGLRPAQTPQVVLTGGIGWNRDGRAASLLVRHAGAQFEDDLNSVELPSATTFDAFAAWPLSSRVQLVLRGENLLDERVVAAISGDGTIERATPQTLWVGLRFSRSSAR